MSVFLRLFRQGEFIVLLSIIIFLVLSAPFAMNTVNTAPFKTAVYLFVVWFITIIILVLAAVSETGSQPENQDSVDEKD